MTETRTPDPHCGGLRIQSTGSGTVTRLGAVTWSATECADFAAFPGRIHVRDGRAVLTSANGDELHVSFEADGALPNLAGDVHVSGPLTITGGTGWFRDASGGGTLTADPNISATTSRCRSTPPSRCER